MPKISEIGKVSGFAILAGSIGFGLGAAAGGIIDVIPKTTETVDEIEDEIAENKEQLIIYEGFDKDLQKYGETCLKIASNYTPGGKLYDAVSPLGESQVVDDLLANEDKPCGDDATTVRIKFQDIYRTKTKLNELKKYNFNDRYAALDIAKEEDAEDADLKGWLMGGLALGSIGTLIGIVVGSTEVADDRRTKARRAKHVW